MNSTSLANSSISTTAIVGGGSRSNNTATDEFHFPTNLVSIQDSKDEALLVLKSDLMASLNKEVKLVDEDNWLFEGPCSCIHLMSTRGGFLNKQMEITKNRNLAPPKRFTVFQKDGILLMWMIQKLCFFDHHYISEGALSATVESFAFIQDAVSLDLLGNMNRDCLSDM